MGTPLVETCTLGELPSYTYNELKHSQYLYIIVYICLSLQLNLKLIANLPILLSHNEIQDQNTFEN